MIEPGRKFVQGVMKYRYAFNGKEKSDEVYGEGNVYDYGFRIYDPRLGKFLSVDPLQKQFPWLTPYQFSANSPILFIDLDGREPQHHINNWTHTYDWAKKDYNWDNFENYFTVGEKDSKSRPIIVRTRIIGAYPYTNTQFQYYNYENKNYEYFVPTGFVPDYVQNLRDLQLIGEFGRTMEKGIVAAATMWNPYLRQLMQIADVGGEIDKHGTTSTKERVSEIHKQTNVSDRVKNGVLTIAVADVEDKDGMKYRLVSLNSASQQNKNIMAAVNQTLKPNEILVPNILGGDAHAEENLREFAKKYGLKVNSIDVNRPFCKSCSEERRRSGEKTSTTTSKKDPKARKPAAPRRVK